MAKPKALSLKGTLFLIKRCKRSTKPLMPSIKKKES